MGYAGTNSDNEKVKWTFGKGNDVNAENDVNRSGGSAVDYLVMYLVMLSLKMM